MPAFPSNERVSIITPVYNAAPFLVECIESVLSQTYSDWEMILVDDMSTDESVSIIRSYVKKDARIHLVRHHVNSGAGESRNTGIRHATGRYIAFLDSDDVWVSFKLSHQIHFLKQHQVPLVYSSYERTDVIGKFLSVVHVPKQVTYTDMLKMNYIACLTMCYDRDQVGEIEFPHVGHEDYVVWLSLVRRFGVVFGMTECLAKYRVREKSLSSDKWKSARYQWRVYREIEHLSFVRSGYFFIWYVVLNVLKRV